MPYLIVVVTTVSLQVLNVFAADRLLQCSLQSSMPSNTGECLRDDRITLVTARAIFTYRECMVVKVFLIFFLEVLI